MGTTEHEEPRFFFILNKGAKSGGEITHAVLNGSIVSKPAGWDAFHGLALAKEKLSSEEIQRQMKELGVEMEIVPWGDWDNRRSVITNRQRFRSLIKLYAL